MLFNTFSSAHKQTSSFGKNQHDGYFFLFCKDLCRGQGHGRRSCASSNFCQKPRSGQSQVLKQVHAETAICTEPGFPKEQVSSSCSLTSPIPRSILKSDSSSSPCFIPPYSQSTPKPDGFHTRSLCTAPHKAAQRMQDSHLETETTTRFVPFISFYKLGSRQ